MKFEAVAIVFWSDAYVGSVRGDDDMNSESTFASA